MHQVFFVPVLSHNILPLYWDWAFGKHPRWTDGQILFPWDNHSTSGEVDQWHLAPSYNILWPSVVHSIQGSGRKLTCSVLEENTFGFSFVCVCQLVFLQDPWHVLLWVSAISAEEWLLIGQDRTSWLWWAVWCSAFTTALALDERWGVGSRNLYKLLHSSISHQ